MSVVWHATGEGTPSAPTSTSPCEIDTQYPYGDALVDLSCTAFWQGALQGSYSFPLRVEASNPIAQGQPVRPPDSDGWYNHPVAVIFRGVSSFSGFTSSSCTATTYGGPNTSGTTVTGSCTDNAGKMATASFALHYDATPPTITRAIPSRPPDKNGWYNHPVRFTFTATDAISGIQSCSDVTYGGPASATASLTGTCRDKAGNVATMPVTLKYDATPPALRLAAAPGDGTVALSLGTLSDAAPISSVEILRIPGLHGASPSMLYRGKNRSFHDGRVSNGVNYRYTVTARDQAGNVTVRTLPVTPGPRLLSPASGAHVTAPPVLTWTPIRSASYYNAQLYRGSKVLSAWPTGASLRLALSWRYGGHRYRLKPGRYTWYVWPGYGPRSAARYGPLIGSGMFVVGRDSGLRTPDVPPAPRPDSISWR